MDEKKAKEPSIRFVGFNDDWEQRKLSESEKTKNRILNKGDITMILNDKTASGNIIGRVLLIEKSGVYVYNQRTERIEIDSDNYDSQFVYTMLNAPEIREKIIKQSQGNTQIYVNWPTIAQTDYVVPKLEEQKEIGAYFQNLGNLITLHQRELELMQQYKKAMLQKMFPKEGKDIPEIRFTGFTGAWEQRKLGELVQKYEDPVATPTDGYMRLGIRSHAKGTFHSYVEKGKELETAKMFRVAANNFIVNITFGWEHAVAITDEKDAGKLVSHRFPQYSFKDGMVPKFFRYLILDEQFRHHLELSSPGGAGRNRVLKLSDMLEYKMKHPSTEEQEKISSYFDHLDHLITLHQRELDSLKNFKKTTLQKMFI